MNKKAVEGRLSKQAKDALKARIRYERTFERELEKEIQRYREETPEFFRKSDRDNRPRTILAEGDSWTRYSIGFAIPWHLPKIDERNHVLNIASPGDTASEMLSGSNAAKLGRRIKMGPSRNRKFDVIFFSGGGNDLLGDGRFATFLRHYEDGMSPSELVNQSTLDAAFRCLSVHYTNLIRLRDENSPDTVIYFNAYDFAPPTGKPACGFIGPWMRPHLKATCAPPRMFGEIVNYFLGQYASLLRQFIEHDGERLKVLDTQGTLKEKEWSNEIHPTTAGFRKLAKVVQKQLEKDFP